MCTSMTEKEKALDHYESYMRIERNFSEKSIDVYIRGAARFLYANSDVPLDEFTADHALEYLKDNESNAPIIYSVLNSFFKFLVIHGYAKKNPFVLIETPKKKEYNLSILTARDFLNMLNAIEARGDDASVRDFAILNLMMVSAVKFEELIRLKLDHFDIFANCLYIRKRKGDDEYRILYFDDVTLEIIDQYIMGVREKHDVKNSQYLFIDNNGNPLKSNYGQRMINRYKLKDSNGDRVSLSLIRRSSIALMLQNGMDIYAVWQMTGYLLLDKLVPMEITDDLKKDEYHKRFTWRARKLPANP